MSFLIKELSLGLGFLCLLLMYCLFPTAALGALAGSFVRDGGTAGAACRVPWLQTNGVNNNGVAEKVMKFDRLGKKVRKFDRF